MAETGSTATLTLREANRVRYDVYRRGGPPAYRMSDEERAARRAEDAARDRAHAAVIRAKRAGERALAKAADVARLAVEVDRIRSEIRVGLKPPAGKVAAVDVAGMLLIGPQGAFGCSGASLRTLEVLVGRRRHPVPSLLAAGRWQDEAALKSCAGSVPAEAGGRWAPDLPSQSRMANGKGTIERIGYRAFRRGGMIAHRSTRAAGTSARPIARSEELPTW